MHAQEFIPSHKNSPKSDLPKSHKKTNYIFGISVKNGLYWNVELTKNLKKKVQKKWALTLSFFQNSNFGQYRPRLKSNRLRIIASRYVGRIPALKVLAHTQCWKSDDFSKISESKPGRVFITGQQKNKKIHQKVTCQNRTKKIITYLESAWKMGCIEMLN